MQTTSTSPVRQPQQARSHKTLQAILEATQDLLEEKNFNEISINEIVAHAGCSVGAFYGRFKDKDALLHALDELYFEELIDAIHTFSADEGLKQLDLAHTVRLIVEAFYDLLTRRRGLMRTLILAARTQPDPRFREREHRLAQAFPELRAALLVHGPQIRHPDPEMAVQFGFLQTWHAMRELILWDHIAAQSPIQGPLLVEEFSRAYLAYLQSGDD